MLHHVSNYSSDADSAEQGNNLADFIQSLLAFSPQEAAAKLNTRLLAEEPAGQAYFDSLVIQAEQLVETLVLPEAWQQALRAELKLAREYEVEKPIIPAAPIATPLLTALTSGELRRVFDELMFAPVEYVPLLAETALRQHKVNAADEWEGVRFLDMLLHMNRQGTRNPDNQRSLGEWGAGVKLREEQAAQEQLLPERKQVVTEMDRPRLMQRLRELSEHWEAKYNPKVQDVIQLIEQRLLELDAAQPASIVNEQIATTASLSESSPYTLSTRQIALLHIFNHKTLRLDSRIHELGQKYGFKNGRTIYDHYIKLKQPTGITGIDGRQLPSFIADIEAVLPLVEKRFQQEALDNLKVLKIKRV